MIALGALGEEMRFLVSQAEEKYYGPLLLFGEHTGPESHKDLEPGDHELQIARLLPLLDDLSNFVSHAYTVVKQAVWQLNALYPAGGARTSPNAVGIHVTVFMNDLGRLLSSLVTLDEIVDSNGFLRDQWVAYKRMCKSVRAEPARFGTEEEKLRQFERFLQNVEGQLFDGMIFMNAIQQPFMLPDGSGDPRLNRVLPDEMFQMIKDRFTALTSVLGQSSESDEKYRLMDLFTLYSLYFQLFMKTDDKKFLKAMWDVHRRIPAIALIGSVVWQPSKFLIDTIPWVRQAIPELDVMPYLRDYVKASDANLARDVQGFFIEIGTWMVRMESDISSARAKPADMLNTRLTLFIRGLVLAEQLSNLFKESLAIHLNFGIPMKSAHVGLLCKSVELIKSIQYTFHRRSVMVADSANQIMQQLSIALHRIFVPIKKRMETHKKHSDMSTSDPHAAVTLMLQLLQGSGSDRRRWMIRCASGWIIKVLGKDEASDFSRNLRKLDILCELQTRLRKACDCSFMFWARSLLPNYFSDVYQNPELAHRMQYLVASLGDCAPLLNSAVHNTDPHQMLDGFKKEVEEGIMDCVVNPLCRDIETDLRLHIHTHLHVDTRDPFKRGLKNLSQFLEINPLRFFDETFSVKKRVTHYLDTTFYNLTTVALHDWKTYEEMRNLAHEKYGLELNEVHLPGATLEQGLDVLEIMRNIHIFVAAYNYNLNNQIFIEKQSDSKHLNTINIRHIANSIRTHGTGIMNTTVNFTYQFLARKFNVFSQFLYDDHIKSRLLKDIRYFKENKDELDLQYPFERSEKFNREIRKLGVTEGNLSYLDRFRMLITEIGNAMGYVRMVRSGGLHHISNAIKFVPDLQDISSFEESATTEQLSPETASASKNLDQVIDNLSTNFAEGTEYFKVLVEVFSEQFRSDQNLHLRNFYIIIPPLTINYVEHMLVNKDRLHKKGKEGNFTDDGFAIGIAYILKLLDQYRLFDSLHWFDNVKDHYSSEGKKVKEELEKRGKRDKKEATSALLTLEKMNMHLREFELLYFSFSGARVFFRD